MARPPGTTCTIPTDPAGKTTNSAAAQQVPGANGGPWGSGTTTRGQTFNPRRWATPGQSDTISTFRTRQYDPATGAWLQEDPSGLAGGINLYQYNGNDPNSFSDPFGLAADCPDCGPDADAVMLSRLTRAVVAANAPTRAQVVRQATHNAAGIIAVVGGLEDAAAGGIKEGVAFGSRTLGRIVSEGEDATRAGASETNLRHPMPRTQLEAGLRSEGFSSVTHPGGAVSFGRDATRVTTYIDKSFKGPAAQVYFQDKSVLKIRLGPEP